MIFYAEARSFLEKLNQQLNESNVFLDTHWNIDHLCYRVPTLERYEIQKIEFLKFSRLLIESEVNGRMISTFKLDKPISFGYGSISVVELPAPKVGKATQEGFEHIEVVCDLSFQELEKRFKHIQVDKTGLNKKINQEFELCLGERNLKFHHISLESLIKLESNKPVWQALEKSEVLNLLKEFSPVVVGSFPLGLQVEGSDLDILIFLKDANQLVELAKKHWGHLEKFKIQNQVVDNLETLIIDFKVDTVPFQIFAQAKHPVKQKAFLHFLVEERLLKEVGKDFNSLVMRLRKQGLKTEVAFAQALNLTGDPYEALLDLQKKPI